ncbi:MAG: hydrogenase formation protein HypD [Nitrospirae bacterium CG_4_10_14_3_um_filter_44_29]|nr:hydrogenase formation protein HypD [Nitrospirota bacterium]OIO31287.1 MAG: hydrogenase formation protein HypD [Nitrospirae bacterium CG1_02_44_142]PIP69733.1 MAG: hydrogenase formation protein HypD [Nitrospirae bacterium CG22_combo_CG10-13_8_21_14_all_44_11]PIV40358.1 MAG: hydrogenase formation protein HypD [Nitrospirae bacterium CG02_land_8_20_14_3_00_44_33]PIV67605.1 MAG: hydrogenase formation protein HypD [Nitrospirae bacterium CG01_land_8_20_14_3_00_44_22]PIW90751.1 MAG: hydrogenase for
MKQIGKPVRLMEVCGTHTVAIFRQGVRELLPEGLSLISGPGCPVCVTAVEDIEKAMEISRKENVIFTTFGDMMRVPGVKKNLSEAKAEGADIRVLYSPMDALKIASENKDKKIVFFATGFETTSPSVAATLFEAEKRGISNFYIYSVHKLVPPALDALLGSGEVKIDGFILPGHVSAIIGSKPYKFITEKYLKPSVITGFEAGDILQGINMLLEQIASNRAEVEIQYKKVVREEGNPKAVALINEYFEPCDAYWRGIGTIPLSGLKLRGKYKHSDINSVIKIETSFVSGPQEPKGCSCGEILKGMKTPDECPLFAGVCTPESPVGACMVSTEGSCAAYYKYGGHI